jgi:hypothetical protein
MQRADAALSRKLRSVVEPVDVWYCSCQKSLFKQLDDSALEKDDLTLDLVLRNY